MRTLTQDTDATGEEISDPDALKKVIASLTHRKTAVAVAGCATLQALAEMRQRCVTAVQAKGMGSEGTRTIEVEMQAVPIELEVHGVGQEPNTP